MKNEREVMNMIKLATRNKAVNFKNFIDNFVVERHHILVEEADLVRALYVINNHHIFTPDMKAGNCRWVDDPGKCFIHFTTTRAKWAAIRLELHIIRVFSNVEVPRNTVGYVYSTD